MYAEHQINQDTIYLLKVSLALNFTMSTFSFSYLLSIERDHLVLSNFDKAILNRHIEKPSMLFKVNSTFCMDFLNQLYLSIHCTAFSAFLLLKMIV